MRQIIVILAIIVLSATGIAQAQTYPAVANLVMPFPHSAFLFDYYAPGATNMQVTVQLNDFTVANQRVKLQFEIGDGSINLRTKSNYTPPGGILLTPGVPLILQGSDLYDALNSNNLNFSGINASAFNQNGGKIPEGQYEFCVRVLDYNSGKELSLSACANIFIQYEVPPVLITPSCGGYIAPTNPQLIRFSWQVAGMGQPSFFGLNSYILHLYQITDPDIADPLNAVLNSKAVKVYTSDPTPTNTFNLDFSTVALVPGKKYVCRLQGIGPEGKETFQNEGYGEWCWFSYGYPDGGVLALQEPYDGQQFEKTDPRVFVWGGTDKGIQNQPFDYQLTMVELTDTSQAPTDALTNNSGFHQENLPTTNSTSGANFQLTQELNPDKKYAWQVVAYSDGQKVAESETRTFYSHSLIDHFYASNQKIKVVQTGNTDLANFEGVARIQLSEEETDFIDVPFTGLEIRDVAGQMILKNGQINFDLSDRDPLDIEPELPVNGVGQLQYLTGTIDKTGLKMQGKIVWNLPHPVEPGESTEVIGKESTFVMNSGGLLSGESAIEVFQTVLLSPKGFGIRLKETSKLQLADNKLIVQVLGSISLPPSVTTFNGAPITVEFKEAQTTLDYIELPNLLGSVSGGIGPINGLGLEFIPLANGVIDLSEDASPGKLSGNKTWKGFYIQDYKTRMNVVNFDPSNQVTVPERLDTNLTTEGSAFRFWVDGTGLSLKTDFSFSDKEGLLFNQFQTETFFGELDIRKSKFKTVKMGGTTRIPFIDDDREFEFTIPTTENGPETGYIEGLEDLEFIYNPYGGENRMDFTINRATFVDNSYLQLNCDILCAEMDITIDGQEDLRIYGDYIVGFGGRNTSVALDAPVDGFFKSLAVSATEIGAAFLGNEYAVSLSMESYLSEGFTDKEGGPPTFTMSSVAVTSAEAPEGTPVPQPSIEVPDSLADNTEIEPTGFDISIETPILDASAYLLFWNDDPTWGTRFAAGLNASLKVPARYNLGGNMTLGFVDGMDYWYFDAYFEDVDGEGIQVMVPYVGKVTNIVGVEGQVFRHVKSKKTESGDFELTLSEETQFGAKIFLQLIDPYAKGFIYQADLGLEVEIRGPGVIVENIDMIMSGQASFLNLNFRTGVALGAGDVLKAASSTGILDKVVDEIFPQSFEMLGKQITLDSKGLSKGSSIEIGSIEGGEGLLLGGKVSSKPGIELGVAYDGYKVYGMGDANGSAKIDLEIEDFALKAELKNKSSGSFSLKMDDLSTSFSGDYPKKKADLAFSLDDFSFKAGIDAPKKSGYFDYAYDGKEIGAYLNIPRKAGGVKLVYDDKRVEIDVDVTAKSTAFKLEYGDYKYAHSLNLTEKSGAFFLETPTYLIDIAGRPNYGKFKAEKGEYLIDVEADFTAKTGKIGLTFPNHKLLGELKTDRGSIFLKKDDFEIGLDSRFDGTAGDLHVKEGSFVFDLGADLNNSTGYLNLQEGSTTFSSRYDPADTSFIYYSDGTNLYEARVGMGKIKAQYKDSENHFLLELDKVNVAGRTIFEVPDFKFGSEFDASQSRVVGEIEVLGHKVRSAIIGDSMSIGYKNGQLVLQVAGKYQGGGSVFFEDKDKNIATGFSYDIVNKAGEIKFKKDDLDIIVAGNKTAKTGLLGFKLNGDSILAFLDDSLYVATAIDGYTFQGVKGPTQVGGAFSYDDTQIFARNDNNGTRLALKIPDHAFTLNRKGSQYDAFYKGNDLELSAGVGGGTVRMGMKKDDHEVEATVSTAKKVTATYKKSGWELDVDGDLQNAIYGVSVGAKGWVGSVSNDFKTKDMTLRLSKDGIGVDATFKSGVKMMDFAMGGFKLKGGLDAGLPKMGFEFGGSKLSMGDFANGISVSSLTPGSLGGIQFDMGDVKINLGKLDVNTSPDISIDLSGTKFNISPTVGNLCGIDLTRDNTPLPFNTNQFDQTVNGNRLRVTLNPDDSKNVLVEIPDLKVDVTYRCDQLPAIKVVYEGKTYAFIIQPGNIHLQYDDYQVKYASGNHELEVKAGTDFTFLINDTILKTDIEDYYLSTTAQNFMAGNGQTYLKMSDEMVAIHADDKFIEIHSDDTYLMQVDTNKNFALTSSSLGVNVGSKHLKVSADTVAAWDTEAAFSILLSSEAFVIQKDAYALAVGAEEVRFDHESDFVSVGKEVLAMQYGDKILSVSANKEVRYKDDDRELAASETSLYIDYEGKILDVKPEEVRLELASDKIFIVKQDEISAEYEQHNVKLTDPLGSPGFVYQDNRVEVKLSGSEVGVMVDGYGALAGDDKLHVYLKDDYIKYQESDLDFKYGRYIAEFDDWESVFLTNGIQEFGVAPNELMAALDSNNRIKVYTEPGSRKVELYRDDAVFRVSKDKAELDYEEMRYALGKTEYIRVHPLDKPDEGFTFSQDGIRYNFDANNYINAAPKKEYLRLQLDNKHVAFRDDMSLQFGMDDLTATIYKDLSLILKKGNVHSIELNKKTYMAGYTYLPKKAFARVERFDDNYIGLVAGASKYSGFVKPAKNKSIEVGGRVEGLGEASIAVNMDKDVVGKLKKSESDFIKLAMAGAKTLEKVHIKLKDLDLINYGGDVDAFGDELPGVSAVGGDGPSHIALLTEKAGGWGVGGLKFRRTIGTELAFVAQGRIQTGLSLPIFCAYGAFGVELRPNKVRIKIGDINEYVGFRLLCIPGLPPLFSEEGYADLGFDVSKNGASFDIGAGYRIRAGVAGGFSFSIAGCEVDVSAGFEAYMGFGGRAALAIPFDGSEVKLELGPIFAEVGASAYLTASACGYSFGVSAAVDGRLELEGDLDGGRAQGVLTGHFSACGLSKSFDFNGVLEL